MGTFLAIMGAQDIEPLVLQGPYLFLALRSQFGISQERLAECSGVSARTIGKLETQGKISLFALEKLAPHLAISYEDALQILALQQRRLRKARQGRAHSQEAEG